MPPHDAAARAAAQVPEGASLLQLLACNAAEHGRSVAMRERNRGIWEEFTWQQYLEQVLAAAAGLEGLGLGAQDKLLVVGDNRPALYFGMVGAIALRAIPSPAYPDFTPEQLLGQVQRENIVFALAEDQEQVDKLLDLRERHPQLRWIIYDDPRGLTGTTAEGVLAFTEIIERGRARLRDNPALAQELVARSSADDVAVLLHSSGTTGAPKGVPLKHRQVLAAVRNAAAAGFILEGETHMAYMPIAWVGDFIFSVSAAVALRFSVNIPENQETLQHDMREIAPTVYFTSPRAWSTMLTRVQIRPLAASPSSCSSRWRKARASRCRPSRTRRPAPSRPRPGRRCGASSLTRC